MMTQQQKAAFNQQYIYNQNLGWRDRYVHEGGLTHTLQSEQGINAYDRNYIYNPEEGWRERTNAEKTSKTLDVTLGPALKAVGDGTVGVAAGAVILAAGVVKYTLYLGAAVGIAYVGSVFALSAYDSIESLVN